MCPIHQAYALSTHHQQLHRELAAARAPCLPTSSITSGPLVPISTPLACLQLSTNIVTRACEVSKVVTIVRLEHTTLTTHPRAMNSPVNARPPARRQESRRPSPGSRQNTVSQNISSADNVEEIFEIVCRKRIQRSNSTALSRVSHFHCDISAPPGLIDASAVALCRKCGCARGAIW